MVADRAPTSRLVYLDNLKWVLVAGIIAAHAATAYGAAGAWIYTEPTLSPLAQIVFSAPMEVGIFFGLGTFMLVAGLLTPRSLARKGAHRFLGERLLRLGAPLLVTLVVVTPAVVWLIVEVLGYPMAMPDILRWQLQHLEPMQMWFVAVLLLFTICYAGWRWLRPATKTEATSLRIRHLVVAAALIAAFSFLVRLVFPIGSQQPFSAHLWMWPQLAVLFAVGVLAGERGWLDERPSALIRRACWLAPLPALAVVAWMVVAYGASSPTIPPAGGWHWQAALLAIAEGVVAVGFSLALVDLFRQAGQWSGRLVSALGRDSYAAFFLQLPVLTALELGLRRFAWPGEAKLAVVAPAGVVLCFALAWAIRRALAAATGRRWTTTRSKDTAPDHRSRARSSMVWK